MKNRLSILFLTLTLNLFGQNTSQQLIEQTAEKIGIEESANYHRLATTQKFENGILVVIPEIAEKEEGYLIFNCNVVLIDDETGAVKSKFRGDKDWYIDAISMDKIEIEPQLYHLNETTLAYGIMISYYSQSKPYPYYGTELSLYALLENELNLVLKDYPINTFNGETDTRCKGIFEEHSKKLEVLNTLANGFADLKITDEIEISELNADCEIKTIETRSEVEILKYENEEYKKGL